MREMLFKNLTSEDAHRRDLILSETILEGNLRVKTQRRSTYYIKDCKPISKYPNIDKIKSKDGKSNNHKKHCYILKNHNTKTGEDKLFFRTRGTVYAIIGDYVYEIGFLNAFKVNLSKHVFPEGKV